MMYAEETVKKLKESEHIIIYGARIVAKEVASCLMGPPYFLDIDCFMVTSKEDNPSQLLNLPVIDISEGEKVFKNPLILVAALEKYQAEIQDTLKKHGFANVVPLGFESDLWSELRGNYIQAFFSEQGKKYLDLETELSEDIHVYMAKCHLDRKIDLDASRYGWEIPIQVGADLTDEIISHIRDNTGDNISIKNRKYCELTALYWIWKNDNSKFKGLCHYRRHFDLDQKTLDKLAHSDIDVILTIPILNFPSVRATYANDHIEADWDVMFDGIRMLQPEYYGTADTLQNGIYYYAYNMFIARKEIFDSYCEWLFPILEYCEERCGEKENQYQNRYIGFLAERLMSIYFIHNEYRWKIVHAKKEFLECKEI